MSLTLGEKLREAREERGFSIAEVAEQTRISSLYLESIEHDDYRTLPGGIFNKGFVKSYAKFVGLNEQEALADYAHLLSERATSDEAELKIYKPEVLTDDRTGASMIPTVIIAVIILGIMSGGILFLVNYLRRPAEPPVNTASTSNSNTSDVAPTNSVNANKATLPTDAPDMATLKVEFKALNAPVSLSATSDGKMSSIVVTPGSSAAFEPKEALKLSYSKSLANAVELTINGKKIALPAQPLVPRRNAIEFEINKENIGRIWSSGSITTDVPAAVPPDANANVPVDGVPPAVPVATPARPTPGPKPSVAANTDAKPTEPKPNDTPKPVAATPKPTPKATPKATPPKPATNTQ
ncbi:hypothetical protein BH10ACI2_BH10ACI2_26300 [soil metagenome]